MQICYQNIQMHVTSVYNLLANLTGISAAKGTYMGDITYQKYWFKKIYNACTVIEDGFPTLGLGMPS